MLFWSFGGRVFRPSYFPCWVAIDLKKIQTLLKPPIPKSTKEINGFLDLSILPRLWGNHNTFNKVINKGRLPLDLKSKICFHPVETSIKIPSCSLVARFSQSFVVECDAYGVGIRAILSQHDQLVPVFSDTLKGSALALSTYKKEMLVIIKAIHKWHSYLLVSLSLFVQTKRVSNF